LFEGQTSKPYRSTAVNICFTETVYDGSRCNSTVTLDDSRPVIYIRVPGGFDQVADRTITTSGSARAYSTSGRRRLSPSCPTMFRTRPGQRIAATLYSFRGGHVAPKPEAVRPDAVSGSCDVGPLVVMEASGRKRVQNLCDPRQHREQRLLTTNSSHVAVFFADLDQLRPTRSPPPRTPDVSHRPLTNYIIKLQGPSRVYRC